MGCYWRWVALAWWTWACELLGAAGLRGVVLRHRGRFVLRPDGLFVFWTSAEAHYRGHEAWPAPFRWVAARRLRRIRARAGRR